MEQVFKFNFQDAVRRWMVPTSTIADSTTITFKDLESKIREFFKLPSSSLLAITYVDQDNDTVTVANDQDLIDACIVQGFNPLRLDVAVIGSTSKECAYEPASFHSDNPCVSAGDVRYEDCLKGPENLFWSSKEDLASHPIFFKRPSRNIHASRAPRHGHVSPQLYSIYPSISYGEVNNVDHYRNFESVSRNSLSVFPNHQLGHLRLGDKFDRGHRQRDAWTLASVLHWGIDCDGCGISPIEGPRYKSIKESDFDLCEKCFRAWGNQSDYVKFDRPDGYHPWQTPPPPPPHHHGHYRPQFLRRVSGPLMAPPISRASFSGGAYGGRHSHPMRRYHTNSGLLFDEQKHLDAQFVKDVTIFDGTELAPGARFTKIWRFSNVGILPWPQGTQLLHIEGDLLGSEDSFILELPEIGVPCGEEVDVSVDLVAPEEAGRYVSHWCLSAPSGQNFGHRVWVVIQVITHEDHLSPLLIIMEDFEESTEERKMDVVEDSGGANMDTIDLNSNGVDQVMVDGESLLMDRHDDDVNRRLTDKNLNGDEEALIDAVVDCETVGAGQVSLQTPRPNEGENHTGILCPGLTSRHMDVESDNLKIEDEGFSLVENPNESTDWFDVSEQVVDEDDGQKGRADEEVLLHRNIPILHTCKLESTVDDLVLANGWNGNLEILEEMGFADKHTNVHLLMKNNGSLKQTVRELVKLEKQ